MTKHNPPPTQFLSTRQASERLGLCYATLVLWRRTGAGPAYYSFGDGPRKTIRYDVADLDKWCAARRKEG